MKRLCDFYIRHAGWIGAVYCAAPNFTWFLATFLFVPFRTVYLLRLSSSLLAGCVTGKQLEKLMTNPFEIVLCGFTKPG